MTQLLFDFMRNKQGLDRKDYFIELVLGVILLALRKCGMNLDKKIVQKVRNTYKEM